MLLSQFSDTRNSTFIAFRYTGKHNLFHLRISFKFLCQTDNLPMYHKKLGIFCTISLQVFWKCLTYMLTIWLIWYMAFIHENHAYTKKWITYINHTNSGDELMKSLTTLPVLLWAISSSVLATGSSSSAVISSLLLLCSCTGQ